MSRRNQLPAAPTGYQWHLAVEHLTTRPILQLWRAGCSPDRHGDERPHTRPVTHFPNGRGHYPVGSEPLWNVYRPNLRGAARRILRRHRKQLALNAAVWDVRAQVARQAER